MSDRCLPITVRIWEGRADGVESVLEKGVRHSGRVTIRRGDVDGLIRDDLRRRDAISSPIPVRRPEVLCSSCPPWLFLVLLGNGKSMLLHQLLYNPISIVIV